MIKLGLTGSIGMGKTATAALFKAEGAPVYDADAAVHELYGVGGDAVAPVEAAFPGVAADGFVDRVKLSQAVLGEPSALKRLEAIVHPLVGRHRVDFFEQVRGAPVVVLDIPLLFETGGEKGVDAIAVVTAPLAVQRERVMQRPGMTAEKLDAILARQTPDADKRARADFVIDTSKGFALAKREVRSVLNHLADPLWWTARKRPLDEGRDASH